MSEFDWYLWLLGIALFIWFPPDERRRIDEFDDCIEGDVTDWQDHHEVTRASTGEPAP